MSHLRRSKINIHIMHDARGDNKVEVDCRTVQCKLRYSTVLVVGSRAPPGPARSAAQLCRERRMVSYSKYKCLWSERRKTEKKILSMKTFVFMNDERKIVLPIIF